MSEPGSNVQGVSAAKLALFSLFLGITAVVFIPLAVLLAVSYPLVGAFDLFRWSVLPLSLAAIIVGAIAGGRAGSDQFSVRRRAKIGLILGIAAIGIIILVFLAALLFFLPLLGA